MLSFPTARFCFTLLAIAAVAAGCSDAEIYSLEAKIVVDPDHIDFGAVTVGTLETRDVRIINAGQAAIDVTQLSLRDGDASLIVDGAPAYLAADAEILVHISYSPMGEGDTVEDVFLVTNSATEEPVEVPITASPLIPEVSPDIYADPPAADFGIYYVGTWSTQVFDIGNGGFAPLEISSMELVGDPAFTLDDDGGLTSGMSLDVGSDPARVIVRFAPTAMGANDASLWVYSNDPDEPELQIPLAGEGMEDAYKPPVAVCSVSPASPEQYDTLTWYGEDSFDPSGNVVTAWTWTILDFPAASSAGLSGSGANRTTDTDEPGWYSAQLVVTNDVGLTSEPCIAEVEVSEAEIGPGPVAVCSVDPTEAAAFETLHWYGDDSYDPDGLSITAYTWTVETFPSGSSASLTGSGANRTTVTDLAGEYTGRLVVTNELGQVSSPCYATATVTPTEDLWIEMFWSHSGDDMDLHLLKPGGSVGTNGDCYYANCTGGGPNWGSSGSSADDPSLDLDDIPGTGPENINIGAPADGVYTVIVNDYPGSVYNSSNPTTVNIYVSGSLVGSFTDNMTGGENDYWYVATVEWPSGAVVPL